MKSTSYLSNYGYSILESRDKRRKALQKAVHFNSLSKILKRLNLIEKFQSNKLNKQIMNEDILYLKELYYKQHGGNDFDSMEEIMYPKIESHQIIEKCGKNGCDIREQHIVNDSEIIFSNLDNTYIDSILQLDLKYFDSNQIEENVIRKINRGNIIGIIVDKILKGYCQFEFLDNEIIITWFITKKAYGTPLYIFIEKYFSINNVSKIIIIVNLEDIYAIRRINFWYHMNFECFEINNIKHELKMIKEI
uniref:N-acetyltransferase domain-containing protein n=1 Tax=viral metagenome TaxID=1070528 RepID=A0A6C0LU36_9ZZZZ